MRSLCLSGVLTLLTCLGCGAASTQDTAAEEARHRAMVTAQLPPDAAKVMFGRGHARGGRRRIGSYERGCVSRAKVTLGKVSIDLVEDYPKGDPQYAPRHLEER
jgi:hypothetical protein